MVDQKRATLISHEEFLEFWDPSDPGLSEKVYSA